MRRYAGDHGDLGSAHIALVGLSYHLPPKRLWVKGLEKFPVGLFRLPDLPTVVFPPWAVAAMAAPTAILLEDPRVVCPGLTDLFRCE